MFSPYKVPESWGIAHSLQLHLVIQLTQIWAFRKFIANTLPEGVYTVFRTRIDK
jgi:hypothetical protein